MKNKSIKIFLAIGILLGFSSCLKNIEPQSSFATKKQVANSPYAFESFVDAITNSLVGDFPYGGSSNRANDFGLPAFFLERDVMGQDIFNVKLNWWSAWYQSSFLGQTTGNAQLPWTCYYSWIKNCNTVLDLVGETPSDSKKAGAGIAYAMRAYFYMDLARMYAPKSYTQDKNAETVPIVTEKTTTQELYHNPRATNEKMWAFIIEDLNQAETLLDGYVRHSIETPDVSVVYGLKARAYLEIGDWANAEKYAKKAQTGYALMGDEEYTSRDNGFNTPNNAWMLGCQFKSDDPAILRNDADTSWGSHMILEINPDPTVSACGYASNYGQFFLIDRHLYETIPSTDFRKKCFVDFSIDKLDSDAKKVEALKAYSDYPEWLLSTVAASSVKTVGGLPLKFRAKGGVTGHNNQYVGFVVAIPMMRVEEMYLIEAEAAGMQDEARGIALLTAFAKTRDASYVYGKHNEAYGNKSTSKFQNEIWWQRRVELWGEGFATFDIKRLDKGIIRSYEGTNHIDLYQWNTESHPSWMNYVIVDTEARYNPISNNPTPIPPTGNSPVHIWE